MRASGRVPAQLQWGRMPTAGGSSNSEWEWGARRADASSDVVDYPQSFSERSQRDDALAAMNA